MDVDKEVVKAYIASPKPSSLALKRVITALAQYVPSNIEIVADLGAANLVVLHVIGRQDGNTKRAKRLRARGKQYAVIQYTVRNTREPSTENWFPIWRDAVLTWSYYDLKRLCAEDGVPQNFPFYHAPLGVDSTVFYPRDVQRKYLIGTSGDYWLSESIREAVYAAKRVRRPVFHLGPELNRGSDVTCVSGIDDDTLASWYSQCEFVAGLRRTEGFELPAAEGLLCGARPVCYDQPHYRQWFDPWAVFIPETSRAPIIDDLEVVFRQGAYPVTKAERDAAKIRFDWNKIITGFWNRVLWGMG